MIRMTMAFSREGRDRIVCAVWTDSGSTLLIDGTSPGFGLRWAPAFFAAVDAHRGGRWVAFDRSLLDLLSLTAA